MFKYLTCILLLAVTAQATENWPEFRGPTGQGVSTAKTLPTEWNGEQKRNIVWHQAIPGKGWSSPVIHDGKVYLTTAVPTGKEDGQLLRALCLDAASGAILWNKEVFEQGKAKMHGKNSHASPTPITDGKFLFVHFGTNGTACLNLAGKKIWETRELVYDPEHGNGGSPALGEKAIVISCDGTDKQFVVALDRKSGKILWKTPRPANSGRGFSFSTPLIIESDGKRQVISSGSDYVVSYDLEKGDELWRFNYPTGYSGVPRPTAKFVAWPVLKSTRTTDPVPRSATRAYRSSGSSTIPTGSVRAGTTVSGAASKGSSSCTVFPTKRCPRVPRGVEAIRVGTKSSFAGSAPRAGSRRSVRPVELICRVVSV